MRKPTKKQLATDPGQYLPLLALYAADKVRLPKEALSRSAALAAAPWEPDFPGGWEREFREAFADRLEERGAAKPSARAAGVGGKRGKSGGTELIQCRLYLSKEEQAEQKAIAKAADLSWSTWARRKLAL